MIRLVRKSYNAVSRYGFKEFLKRLFVFFDRKFRPGKYYHLIGEHSPKPLIHNTGRITQNAKHVLFISGEPKNATSYYRCEIPAKQLETQGWQVDIVYEAFTTKINPRDYSHIIFYRTPLNDLNQRILDIAKENKIKTLFSIDDFVYRRDLVEKLEYTHNLDARDRQRLLDRADGMLVLMKKVDAGISSTKYLASHMGQIIKGEVFVNRNGIILNSVGSGSNQTQNAQRKKHNIILGYFSGSETHDRDFAMIWPAIENILAKHENVELWLGGRLDDILLNTKRTTQNVKHRIKYLPFMPCNRYMQTLSHIDINLFPLEDSEFNRGKSEIKFIEAAIAKTPSIISSVGDMKGIITDFQTGILVENLEEWESKLESLIQEPKKREKMGNEAHKYVIENYNLDKLGKELVLFLDSIK